jgi:hypothetical protein
LGGWAGSVGGAWSVVVLLGVLREVVRFCGVVWQRVF